MRKKVFGTLILVVSILIFEGMTISAENFSEIDTSKIAGYYYVDDKSMLILPGNLAYLELNSDGSSEKSEISVWGNKDNFIVICDNDDQNLYFSRKLEKNGEYYAVYSEYMGTSDDVDYEEGKYMYFGDYIFENEYDVAQRCSLSSFFGIENTYITENGKIEGEGYSTPEKAVIGFIDGFISQSVKQMESAFAIETFANNFDLEAYIEKKSAYINNNDGRWIPRTSEFALEINISNRQDVVWRQIRDMYFTLINAKTHTDGAGKSAYPYRCTENEMDEFIKDIFPNAERKFDIVFEGKFIEPEVLAESYTSESSQKSRENQLYYLKADDIKSMVALLSIDGEKYLLCMDVVLYGDSWYVYQLSGLIGNILGMSYLNPGLYPLDVYQFAYVLSLL